MSPQGALVAMSLAVLLVAGACHAVATAGVAVGPTVLIEAHCDNALRVRIAPPGAAVQTQQLGALAESCTTQPRRAQPRRAQPRRAARERTMWC